jgi:hypothetical protein
MTVPLTGELFETPEVFGRLAGFLRDVTGYAPAEHVYALIMEYRQVPDHDPRVDGMVEDPAVFEAVWTMLTAGVRLPHTAWQSVVLPVVVACSTERDVKIHLGLAASFWVAAKAASDLLAAESIAAGTPAQLSEPTELESRDASLVPAGGRAAARAARGPRLRWALAGVVAVVLLLIAAALSL